MANVSKIKITPKGAMSPKFEAVINPESIQHNAAIVYNSTDNVAMGVYKPDVKFSKYQSDKLSFKIILDGTGVIDPTATKTVAQQLTDLKSVAYNYVGKNHEPNVVNIIWGSFLNFTGRLEYINITYKLFKPDGSPLRAEVDVSFVEDTAPSADAQKRNASSPDLSHLVVVKAGDTLPMLCQHIYGSPRYYLEVARINDLTNFRYLEPGILLLFPPILTADEAAPSTN